MKYFSFLSCFLKALPLSTLTHPHIKAIWCAIDMEPDGEETIINSYIWYKRSFKNFTH